MTVPQSKPSPTGGLERKARQLIQRADEGRIPARLRDRWLAVSDPVDDQWKGRLDRFRRTVVPWLDATRPLTGQRILEIGTGKGASTVSLAEQGAKVTGLDVETDDLAVARERLDALDLDAELVAGNATDIASLVTGTHDHVVFWAVLEHMTLDERLASLRAVWDHTEPGALVTVIETPNRLWPFDAHTSNLPFFSWLPPELAFQYSDRSPRQQLRDWYGAEPEHDLDHFARRGLGVSFHEFQVAVGDVEVVSGMQTHFRRRNPLRSVGWAASEAGRTERLLRQHGPEVHQAWYQPYLYLTIRR